MKLGQILAMPCSCTVTAAGHWGWELQGWGDEFPVCEAHLWNQAAKQEGGYESGAAGGIR